MLSCQCPQADDAVENRPGWSQRPGRHNPGRLFDLYLGRRQRVRLVVLFAIILSQPDIPTRIGMIDDLRDRISINPEQCGGRPCIRGMRIRVIDILDLYAAGLTAPQILDEMPDLEMDDLTAALRYAARRLDHPVVAA